MSQITLYYVANYRLPTERAHGLQVAKMCQALGRGGVEVHLLYPRRRTIAASISDYYSISAPIIEHPLDTLDWTGKIPRLGFWVQSLTFANASRRFIEKKGFHGTVYSRDPFALWQLARHRTDATLVYEMHTMPRVVRLFHRYLWRRLQYIVVISQGLKKDLERYVPGDRIIVAPDGFDPSDLGSLLSKDQARQRLELPLGQTLVVYTGSLMAWKGVYALADASRHLPDNYRIIMVGGPDSDFQALQRYITGERLDKVILRGHVKHTQALEYLAAADILAMPNSGQEAISRHYTSPLKFFEYLASGKPIASTDLPSLREIGRNFTGIFYAVPDDASSLAQTIMSIDTNKAYPRDLARYTWEARAKNILAALQRPQN